MNITAIEFAKYVIIKGWMLTSTHEWTQIKDHSLRQYYISDEQLYQKFLRDFIPSKKSNK